MSFGFILQAPNNDPVIAIRNTEGIREWIHDFEFLATKCPFLPGGQAKRMMASPQYTTLRVANASTRLVDAVAALQFDHAGQLVDNLRTQPGSALATLLAPDVAANTIFKNPTIYTYASPRTGDALLHVPTTRFSRILIVSPPRRYGSQATVCNLSRNTWRDSTS